VTKAKVIDGQSILGSLTSALAKSLTVSLGGPSHVSYVSRF
jgi:hypothetical protein